MTISKNRVRQALRTVFGRGYRFDFGHGADRYCGNVVDGDHVVAFFELEAGDLCLYRVGDLGGIGTFAGVFQNLGTCRRLRYRRRCSL